MTKAVLLCATSLSLVLSACDGQQYVSPDTVRLRITEDASNVDRVDRCNYVPVLLGDEVKWRYVVKGDLKATLTVTRDSVTVSFEGSPQALEPFEVEADVVREAAQTAENPPSGYTVELSPGCSVKE